MNARSHLLLLLLFLPPPPPPHRFYEDIFKMSGNMDLVKKYGDWFSWDGAPRAKIFARDHSKVKDIPSLIELME